MSIFPRLRDRFFMWMHQNLPACIVITIAIGLCVYLFLQVLDAEAVRHGVIIELDNKEWWLFENNAGFEPTRLKGEL